MTKRQLLQIIEEELKIALDERCQKGYKTHPKRKTKKMYGKTYRNCIKADEASNREDSEEIIEDLKKWFRQDKDGAGPAKRGGWVDCNTCRKNKKTGRKKCKPCGRKKGEKRAKYPSCRPTPSKCGKRGKWGKKSKRGKKG